MVPVHHCECLQVKTLVDSEGSEDCLWDLRPCFNWVWGLVFYISVLSYGALVNTLNGLEILAFSLDGWGNYHLYLMHVPYSRGATDTQSRT